MIRSAEQVAFHLPVAGPTSRMLAYAIDGVAIVLLELAVVTTLLLATPLADWIVAETGGVLEELEQDPEAALRGSSFLLLVALALLLQLGIELGWFTAWELVTGGQSLGKRWLGLRVVRDGGAPPGVREALVRNLLRGVDILPANYLVGLVAMLLSPDGRRLGDLAAGTLVVRHDRPEAAAPLPDDAGDALPFRFERAQIARLGRVERTLLRQTLRRVDELPPQEAEPVLARSVEAWCRRIGHPPVPAEERRAFLQALRRAAR